MKDITDCRDLPSLQTILMMIMFLQCSAKLPTCYSYIGIAMRSAVRMGLHRTLNYKFNFIERETRKRVFWTLRKMDTYVGALLGWPVMMSDDDIDQELPEEVDDEFITTTKIWPMPGGKISLVAATNAHTKLLVVLKKVVRYIYPIKDLDHHQPLSTRPFKINHAKIREIEQDLQAWMDNLSMALRPGGEVPAPLVR